MATILDKRTKQSVPATRAEIETKLTTVRAEAAARAAEANTLRTQADDAEANILQLQVAQEINGADHTQTITVARTRVQKLRDTADQKHQANRYVAPLIAELERRLHVASVAEIASERDSLAAAFVTAYEDFTHLLVAAADAQKRVRAIQEREDTLRRSHLLVSPEDHVSGRLPPPRLPERHVNIVELGSVEESLARERAGGLT